jgi:VTC domain
LIFFPEAMTNAALSANPATVQTRRPLSFQRLDRFEMKFVINGAQRAALMEKLGPHLRADANADETAYYPIVSLYYDNADRDCYWEKVRGVQNRRKFRVRVYGSLDGKLPPTIFIEVKHKCEGRGVKRRVNMPLEEAMRVGEGKWPNMKLNEVDRRTVKEIIDDLVVRREFRPTMVMRYDRRAYAAVDPASDLRVTYDTGIAYRFNNLAPVPDDRDFKRENYMYPDDVSVLEVKITGTIPYWLSVLLPQTGCKMRSHSKYCNALEKSDPVLRAMLSPNWRNPSPYAGDTEMDFMSGVGANSAAPEPIIAPTVG